MSKYRIKIWGDRNSILGNLKSKFMKREITQSFVLTIRHGTRSVVLLLFPLGLKRVKFRRYGPSLDLELSVPRRDTLPLCRFSGWKQAQISMPRYFRRFQFTWFTIEQVKRGFYDSISATRVPFRPIRSPIFPPC